MPLIRASQTTPPAGKPPTFLQSGIELPAGFGLFAGLRAPLFVARIDHLERLFEVRARLAFLVEECPYNVHLRAVASGRLPDLLRRLEAFALPFETPLDAPR